MNKMVLDLETKNAFFRKDQRDFSLLNISVIGIYIYNEDKYLSFRENEIAPLEELLKKTDLLIGFNIKGFDIPILQRYLSYNLSQIPVLDIMEEITKNLSFRVSLNNIAKTTLGKAKLGSGLDAIKYYECGQWDKLIKYCLEDVKITKEIYEFGLNRKEIYFIDKNNQKWTVPVTWA